MHEGDIRLDNDGNTVVTNGDLAVTADDAQFVLHMLITAPGSWRLWPSMGVGLQKFIGERITADLIKKIRFTITDFFRRYSMQPNITLYAINDTTVVGSLVFTILGNAAPLPIEFSFNMENGSVTAVTDAQRQLGTTIVDGIAQTSNKYLKRRT